MKNLSERISALTPERRALFEAQLKERGLDPHKAQPITRHLEHNLCPLSIDQERLWVIDRMEPGNAAYNVYTAIRLMGPLDVAVMEESLNEIIKRHEILRTTFTTVDEEPRQVIAPELRLTLPVFDLRALPEPEREAEALRLTTEQVREPFDLERGPLLRLSLLRLDDEDHILPVTLHHTVTDRWTFEIIEKELAALYQAFSAGQPSPLPELPIQYADYALWQREWLKSESYQAQLAYWRKQLRDAPFILELRTDRPRPAVYSFRGVKHYFALSAEASKALKALAQREGVTMFMLLLAAFQTLLHRYTDQEEILVGSPIANRNRTETENLIGYLLNMLVMRASFASDPTFRDLLRQVRQAAAGAYAHQDLPFGKLVEEMKPPPDAGRNPLFQVAFVFVDFPESPALKFMGLTATPLDIDSATARFDLTLAITEEPHSIYGFFEYPTDLFEGATIERMVEHFKILLDAIIYDADRRISELPLMSAAEQRLVLELPGVKSDYPKDRCLHQLFEAQVERTPDAPALSFEDERLTYAELNGRANQLAHYLQRLGIRPETRVGVLLSRSVDMLVAILAILKAGGAYMPLDPAYPQERLAFMLSDAETPMLLTQQSLAGRLPQHPARVVHLDEEREAIALCSAENPHWLMQPENIAYVIYTSGSTGIPKGVMVSHANVARLFSSTRSLFDFDERDVWTLFHSFAFDFSVWEIWGALLYGGRLVIVPYTVSRSPEAFYQLLCHESVTVLNQTPSAFRQLIQADERINGELALRLIIFGGEALELQSLEPWFARHGEARPRLVNMYGITETTVHVTARTLKMSDLSIAHRSIIGRPLPDLQVYVLDRHLHPAPMGLAGEMYVAGAGLSAGYLKRAELTAERFLPHSFSTEPGARLYKTGDLARYLADGDLEYLGRCDQQVKVRGFRIEPAEIEAALKGLSAIRRAVVLAQDDGSGEARLVAYIVCDERAQVPTTSELRGRLKVKLPEHMIPSVFIFLDALPLTPSGKLDKSALPLPQHERPVLRDAFMAPRNLVEEILASIWSQVLGLDRVGTIDNFFELGGDSIRSIQVSAKARQQGLNFPVQHLFRYPTIRELARTVKTSKELSLETPLTAPFALVSEEDRLRLPLGVADAYPLTMLQAGMLFHSEFSSETAVYHDIFSFHLCAQLDVEAFRTAAQQLLARHDALRTSFDLAGFSEPLQLVHREVELPLQVEDLGHLSQDEQERALATWMDAERDRNFDWTRPPLSRFQVHRRSEKTFQFTLSFHHAILDGWSVAVMLTELFQRYFLLLGAGVGPLEPQPRASFRDFVAAEREALDSLEAQAYWTEALRDFKPTRLPRMKTSERAESALVPGVLHVDIPQDVSNALKGLARAAAVPVKSVLLAAHLRAMSLLSGETDVLTALVSHGRPETAGGESVLGLFLNTLPFRQSLRGGSWIELVRGAFEGEREMMPFRRYPMAQLQHDLGGGLPLFETAFNFVHFHAYEGLQNLDQLQVLGADGFEQTNLTFAATFNLDLHTSGIGLSLNYDAAELDQKQVEAISDYYKTILRTMAFNTHQRYESVCLLPEREQRRLLVEWNETAKDYPKERCFHQLFEAQVEQTPDAPALVFEDQRLTYRELNGRANQLAYHLLSLGVGPETTVGICIERSLEMIIALLGTMKAGGAYVPLDPTYPPERLSFMLEDARVSILLTQERLAEKLAAPGLRLLCPDGVPHLFAQKSPENPASGVSADNLAYLIYTSGSMGQPKGVAVEHRQILNYLYAILECLDIPPNAQLATVSTIAADLGNTIIFPALCTGACLHIISEERASDADALADYFACHSIDYLKIVPSHLAALQKAAPSKRIMPGRMLILGGEAARADWVQSLRRAAPECAILNHYGPTETTVGVLTCRVGDEQVADAKFPFASSTVPLGRPVGNVQAYILDQLLQPLPLGSPGLLFISGLNLARSYFLRPALTAERFLPHPFSTEPGARLYRTGDVARYLPTGEIEFVGRVDQQVKVRGYRIELGEIESALFSHPDIHQAVVLAQETGEQEYDEKRLVAYVVPRPERAPTIAGRRRYGLPNNLAVAQLNRNETDYMYREIFELQAYLRHGITLLDGDCVFDVGANTGLFTLFVTELCRRPRIYSFEPNPFAYEILKANLSLAAPEIKLFNCGLSREERTALFRFFPGFSLLSGLYADAGTEKEVVKTFLANQQRYGQEGASELLAEADDILEKRFEARTFPVQLKTLSGVIEDEGVESIDLLKINVEKSELDVLMGIRRDDWMKIKQIVLEVDVRVNLKEILSLLEREGYELAVEQDALLENTELCYVYAIRPSKGRRLIREQAQGSHLRPLPSHDEPLLSTDELRKFLGHKLPSQMIPAEFVLLEEMPLTPNGKIDRRALISLEKRDGEPQRNIVAPHTPIEETLAQVWCQVLRRERASVHDNFFDSGGHSLLATQLISRVREAFGIEIALRQLFDNPTIAGLALVIEELLIEKMEQMGEAEAERLLKREF